MEAVLQRALPDLVVKSAGFFGSDRAVPDISVTLGAKRGLDLARHRSRPLTRATIGAADLIIVMDAYQARQVRRLFPRIRAAVLVAGDLDPEFDSSRGITDPWDGTTEIFEASFNRLDRCAAVLVSVLRRPS
jgi:protein-tyrosine-phosphatase